MTPDEQAQQWAVKAGDAVLHGPVDVSWPFLALVALALGALFVSLVRKRDRV